MSFLTSGKVTDAIPKSLDGIVSVFGNVIVLGLLKSGVVICMLSNPESNLLVVMGV